MQKPLSPFYPVLPDFDWLKRLIPLGLKTVQLRLKNAHPDQIAKTIEQSLQLARQHNCQLIINDYWREAIDLGATYIHLGQGDLKNADVDRIRKAGIRFGLSTHSHEELATALEADPDYIALGPIYETTLKVMPWDPQGLDRLTEWKNHIAPIPLVAIGGITLERADNVLQAGADSIAVVTDLIKSENPEARTRAWLDHINKNQPH